MAPDCMSLRISVYSAERRGLQADAGAYACGVGEGCHLLCLLGGCPEWPFCVDVLACGNDVFRQFVVRRQFDSNSGDIDIGVCEQVVVVIVGELCTELGGCLVCRLLACRRDSLEFDAGYACRHCGHVGASCPTANVSADDADSNRICHGECSLRRLSGSAVSHTIRPVNF